MKRGTKLLDRTATKRSFCDVINDELHTSTCKLIDNTLGLYLKVVQLRPVYIGIDVNLARNQFRHHDHSRFWTRQNKQSR